MRLWLDDVRPAPPNWLWVRNYGEAIDALNDLACEEMSLDHDLGPWGNDEKTGYDVITWLEDQIARDFYRWPIPRIHLHTQNPVGWQRMDVVRGRIRRGKRDQVGMDTHGPTASL